MHMFHSQTQKLKEVAYYQPSWVWQEETLIKNLLLFFDGGVALLVPRHLKSELNHKQGHLIEPLQDQNLLHVLEPEEVIDSEVTKKLVERMLDIIEDGRLDELLPGQFHSLSASRMGFDGNQKLAEELYFRLREKGLARKENTGSSIELHPVVRNLILAINAQLLRPYGESKGWRFSPTTDREELHLALTRILEAKDAPSKGHVVTFDMMTLGVDLKDIPLNEILDFRKQHMDEHMRYLDDVRSFTYKLSSMQPDERDDAFELRQKELLDGARIIRENMTQAWKRRLAFALSISGAVWSIVPQASLIGGLLQIGGVLLGIGISDQNYAGAYSYLIKAENELI